MLKYLMEHFILDTNLFFNMEPGMALGKKTEEVINSFTQLAKSAKERKLAAFYMPPRIVEELKGFFEDPSQIFLKEFLAQINVKSPDLSKIQFPASVFYKMVEEIRGRSYRGLNIAEEELKNLGQILNNKQELNKIELEKTMGPVTNKLRERYRQATRYGFLDSVADLDLITLAQELDGTLVSTDDGVIAWGRTFGVKEMDAAAFGRRLKSLQ